MAFREGLLSICCTCYNHEKYIEDCINSIWENDYKNVEIIVVDDGSTDNSVQVLNRLKEKSPCRFEIITQANTFNIGLNCNRAIAKAQGEYITFMSCDDYYTPTAFSDKLNLMMKDKTIGFAVSRFVKILDNKQKVSICDQVNTMFTNDSGIEELIELEYLKDTYSIQGVIIRHEIIEAINGFDEDIQGDDIVIRLKILKYLNENKQYGFRLIDEPAFVYRAQGNNNSYSNKKWILNIYLDVFDKYWGDRPYPQRVIDGMAACMERIGYENFMEVLVKHPRFLLLTLNNPVVMKTFQRELNKFVRRKKAVNWFSLKNLKKLTDKRDYK